MIGLELWTAESELGLCREVESELARPAAEPLNIQVLPDDAIAPVGEISAILDGDQIIVQVSPSNPNHHSFP